jgi:hypothetical protein
MPVPADPEELDADTSEIADRILEGGTGHRGVDSVPVGYEHVLGADRQRLGDLTSDEGVIGPRVGLGQPDILVQGHATQP